MTPTAWSFKFALSWTIGLIKEGELNSTEFRLFQLRVGDAQSMRSIVDSGPSLVQVGSRLSVQDVRIGR